MLGDGVLVLHRLLLFVCFLCRDRELYRSDNRLFSFDTAVQGTVRHIMSQHLMEHSGWWLVVFVTVHWALGSVLVLFKLPQLVRKLLTE